MKNINVGGYTIDSYFVIAAIGCFVLSIVLVNDKEMCILAGFVNIVLSIIDTVLNNYKGEAK